MQAMQQMGAAPAAPQQQGDSRPQPAPQQQGQASKPSQAGQPITDWASI